MISGGMREDDARKLDHATLEALRIERWAWFRREKVQKLWQGIGS